MLDSNIPLRGQQREIIDYMRTAYRIEDIKVRGGGKHLSIEWDYNGKHYKDTLARNNNPNWIEIRKRDLKKMLGEPPAPEPKPSRTLDAMTRDVQQQADLLAGTAIGSSIQIGKTGGVTVKQPPVIEPFSDSPAAADLAADAATTAGGKSEMVSPPALPVRRFPFKCSTYRDTVQFSLGPELTKTLAATFGERRKFRTRFHRPDSWTMQPVGPDDDGRTVDGTKYRFRFGGVDAIKFIGPFLSTQAVATVHHDRVVVKLAEAPVRDKVTTATNTTATNTEEATMPEPIPLKPPLPDAPPKPDSADDLRTILRLIKDVEERGTYRLIYEQGWRWRAADIGLEE